MPVNNHGIMETHSERKILMEFNQLEQLVTVAEYQTVSRAAEKLHISQPALTRSIQRLEEDLHVFLFDRTKNRITLNENGKQMVRMASELLERKEEMVTFLRRFDEKNRIIRVVSCAPAPCWGVVSLLNKQFPEIRIESGLEPDENFSLERLLDGEADIVITSHTLSKSGLVCRPLIKERLFLSLPPAHPLALLDSVSFADLNGQSVLLLTKIGIWSELTQKMLPDSHLLYQEDVTIFNELTKMSALPNFRTDITLKREPQESNRKAIPFVDDEAELTFYIVTKKEDWNRFAFLVEEIRDLDWSTTRDIPG